ncbi:MAG TPA: ABC transporter ATP-binding protein, partial [Myxococcota bacterium]|nr:ABC transporter ATP-binding protein [Myxococcota bacterium]
MSGAAPLLEVDALTVRIGRRTLVSRLSMQARPGEVWCILGANGAGKTTFLETVVGLRAPYAGAIRIAGRDARGCSPLEAARLRAYLPQAQRDAFGASVLEVVLLGRHPHLSRWEWEGDDDRRAALAALQAVGLAPLAQRDVATLSGGERQRAAIAALMVQDAPLLLLDEPAAQLDLHHQSQVLGHLRAAALEQGRAVVFSVHDLNLAARFATHAMLFHDDGAVDAGALGAVMSDAALSAAFRCPVRQVRAGERTVFLAP